MSPDKIIKYTPQAQEALCSFLATLLGKEAPLKLNAPVPTNFDEANIQSKAYLVLTAGASQADRFAVMLDPRWLPLLSKSMLGEPIEIGEPGADDLLRELAAQAYGALRTQLASAGLVLSEVSFELQDRGADLKSSRFSGDLVELPSETANDDWTHYAHVPDLEYMMQIRAPAVAEEVYRAEFEAAYRHGGLWVSVWHPSISARLSRMEVLDRMLGEMLERGDVWVASLGEIAAHVQKLVEAGEWSPRVVEVERAK